MVTFRKTLRSIPKLLRPIFFRPGFTYSVQEFRADAAAGVTVALIQIPQSMAFALIAGLPAVYGLYASMPGFIASLWGSSKQLSTGPVAVVSLLTLTSLVPFAEPGSREFVGLAALLAILVGIIYLLIGFLRFGFFLHFIPQSVIVGFSSAAAAIIAISQLPTFFGVTIVQHDLVLANVGELLLALPRISFVTTIIGASAIAFMAASRRLPKAFPAALFVLVGGIAASYFFNLAANGVMLIAQVPSSLPVFTLPALAAVPFLSLLPKAGVIALVAFVQAHASARIAARKTKEGLDINQELVGQGFANITSGFFQGFPVSGSLTRTAVNIEAGARTGISSMIAAGMTIIALLFFTPIFYFLPKTVLAGIVIVSALPLIDIKKLREIHHISPMDGYVAFLTFAMAFIFKPDDAIFIGIVAALILFLQRTTLGARAFELGADKEWGVLRATIEEEKVDTFPGVCIVRIGMSLYYANVAHLIQEIENAMSRHSEREKAAVHTLVLDSSAVNFVDITASEAVSDFMERLHRQGVHIAVIYLRDGFKHALETMPGVFDVTVLHNISELKQYCIPQNRTLILSHTQPERLGRATRESLKDLPKQLL